MPHPPRHATRTTRPSHTRQAQTPPPSEFEIALEKAANRADDGASDRSFAELGLPGRLVTALERRGITAPFAIQAKALPDALSGRDVLGRGQTGSGKTLAFGLPLLARLSESADAAGAPRGLVLVPTRELAKQVHDALEPLAHAVGLRPVAVYGGASMYRQVQSLRRGVDLVIATPGRLLDLMRQGECSLAAVEVTVLDEADFMADLGFLPDVRTLLDATPGGQRMLFSATLDKGVDALVRQYLTDPVVHAVASAVTPIASMDHRAFTVTRDDKVRVLGEIALRPARTLVFVRTKHGADRLAKQLRITGAEAVAIHGDMTQGARQRSLSDFTGGRSRVLVATDVAARGLHVDDLDLVVHYDPPADHKDYLHRSGRTARAGASGVVLSLLLPDQRRTAERLFSAAGINVSPRQVRPGHPAVQELATSGEPIVPQPIEPESAPQRSGRSGPWRPDRRREGQSRGRERAGNGGRSGGGRPRRLRPAGDAAA